MSICHLLFLHQIFLFWSWISVHTQTGRPGTGRWLLGSDPAAARSLLLPSLQLSLWFCLRVNGRTTLLWNCYKDERCIWTSAWQKTIRVFRQGAICMCSEMCVVTAQPDCRKFLCKTAATVQQEDSMLNSYCSCLAAVTVLISVCEEAM